jgi:hypothetical protein
MDTFTGYSFSVAFHIELLDMGREFKESLTVRQDSTRLMTANVGVIETN